ncbi:unnamed protein product [Eruca vesicaria subsp. sativa]|uniref:RING-type domain-containing protein n=1 Tax=Eruca vesicaria subsp. sativa TaxID=29727 RepID=A0ABC8KW62_ERUVS|nr:unnamed protein product [Eruca vesicaria subsp. sativa]
MEKKNILKQDVDPFLNCPICNNLIDHPTNITECNHIFCRRCIEDKLRVENLKACPVCNIDLGVAPFDKLKLDNGWNDLKHRFFKRKPKTVKAVTKTSSTSLKTGSTSSKYSRKKKSLTSLFTTSSGVPTPPEPLEPKKLGKENNVLAGASTYKGCIQKENNSGKDKEEIPVSFDYLGKFLSTTDKSNHTELTAVTAITPNGKEKQNTVLTERISSEKPKNKGKEKIVSFSTQRQVSGQKGKGKASSPPVSKPGMHVDMSSGGTSSQSAISLEAEKKTEASNNKVSLTPKKVWFSLIAARNTNMPLLPQISSQNIQTDGNLTVSYVKKYVAKKLGLKSENEVEIWLREESVCPTQKLHELADWWVQTTPIAERKNGMVGRFGAGFVMVLHYSGSYRYE